MKTGWCVSAPEVCDGVSDLKREVQRRLCLNADADFKGVKDENVTGGGGANAFKLEFQRAVTSTSDLRTEATNQRRNVGRQNIHQC